MTRRATSRPLRALSAGVATIALVAGSAVALESPTGAVSAPATVTSEPPTGASANQLNGVSCPTATQCFAVGSSAATASAQQWNGKAWSVVASPKLIGSTLSGISCTSTTNCFAAGSQIVSGASAALIERWNAKSWSISPSAKPSGVTGVQLGSVACTSATFCIAVGSQSVAGSIVSKTFVERWNGKHWSIPASPNPANTHSLTLHAVTCTSTTNCFAVGSYTTAAGALQTLIESWNGTSWSVSASPSKGATLVGELLAVSCSSAKSCFAVGEDHDVTQNNSAVGERWDGKKWTVASPRSEYRTVSHLSGVACTSTTNCITVGYVQNYAPDDAGASLSRVERWNGKKWQVIDSPSPGSTRTQLAAVSCRTASSCVAVGRATNSAFERSLSNLQTLAEQWNGSTWSTMSTPNPINAPFAVFDGVSCPAATACFAVGNVLTAPGHNNTLVQTWNGTAWSTVPTPNPAGASISQLSGISCPSPTNCVAVGRFTTSTSASAANAGPFLTLIEQWNGTSWSIVTSPNPAGATFARLDRVSCTSASSCMAIGTASTTTSGTDDPLAERWNGTVWSVVPSAVVAPYPTGKTIGLSGLSCSGPARCLAAYSYQPGRVPTWESWILTEVWDGTKWSAVSSSDQLTQFDETLSGVSCPSATVCMVTGAYTLWIGASFLSTTTLAEQLNGSAWSVVNSAGPSGLAHPRLDAVSCTSPTGCMSVGASSSTDSSFDAPQTLAEQWNGTSWSVVNTPNPAGAAAAELVSVSCATATNCMAAGDYQVMSTGETKPLTELWNGTTWLTVVPAPAAAAHLPAS